MRVEIVEATLEHVADLAPRVREADRAEIWAAARLTPESALRDGLRVSTGAWAGLIDGEVVCMFGAAPLSILEGKGSPWMLGSDLVERHQRIFLRHSRPVVAAMRSLYPVLVNHVDDRNAAAKRWLHWLGFRLGPAEPRGPDRIPFRRFEMRA
jgi:hypothetical protein